MAIRNYVIRSSFVLMAAALVAATSGEMATAQQSSWGSHGGGIRGPHNGSQPSRMGLGGNTFRPQSGNASSGAYGRHYQIVPAGTGTFPRNTLAMVTDATSNGASNHGGHAFRPKTGGFGGGLKSGSSSQAGIGQPPKNGNAGGGSKSGSSSQTGNGQPSKSGKTGGGSKTGGSSQAGTNGQPSKNGKQGGGWKTGKPSGNGGKPGGLGGLGIIYKTGHGSHLIIIKKKQGVYVVTPKFVFGGTKKIIVIDNNPAVIGSVVANPVVIAAGNDDQTAVDTAPVADQPTVPENASPVTVVTDAPIVLSNPAQNTQTISYLINDRYSYTVEPGESQTLEAGHLWKITFDRGNSSEIVSYVLQPGTYAFQPVDSHWDLVSAE